MPPALHQTSDKQSNRVVDHIAAKEPDVGRVGRDQKVFSVIPGV